MSKAAGAGRMRFVRSRVDAVVEGGSWEGDERVGLGWPGPSRMKPSCARDCGSYTDHGEMVLVDGMSGGEVALRRAAGQPARCRRPQALLQGTAVCLIIAGQGRGHALKPLDMRISSKCTIYVSSEGSTHVRRWRVMRLCQLDDAHAVHVWERPCCICISSTMPRVAGLRLCP